MKRIITVFITNELEYENLIKLESYPKSKIMNLSKIIEVSLT